MAGGNLKAIKRRMKSVNNTMKITKAMELVASSKLKKAKNKMESNKPYFETMYNTMIDIAKNNKNMSNIYAKTSVVKSDLYIVIAGDRGLAGGYNSNVLKLALSKINKEKDQIVAFGNKSKDTFKRHNYNVIYSNISSADDITFSDMTSISSTIINLFKTQKVGKVFLIYTDFVSSLTQEPLEKQLLPLNVSDDEKGNEKTGEMGKLMTYEPDPETVFNNIIPSYINGILYGALVNSYASEQGARRNAMESANDNAKEIISKLDLMYNRARQSAITQEISEIVGGAEALS